MVGERPARTVDRSPGCVPFPWRDLQGARRGFSDQALAAVSVALARRAREERIRAPHARDRRGARRLGRGATQESRKRRRAGVARIQGCLEVHGQVAGPLLVEQGRRPCGAGTQARAWLALAEAEIRVRPHGPSAEGALRTRWLEGGPDGFALLPAGRYGTTQEGSGKPPEGPHLIPVDSAGVNQREFAR